MANQTAEVDAVSKTAEMSGATHIDDTHRDGKINLDELMLAMDVVDTLRHEEAFVERELGEEAREQKLMERLRAIYRKQGIEVPDHVIADGVAALKEDRFTYTPPASGLRTTLAHAYVSRHRWGKKVIMAGLAVILGLAALIGVNRYAAYQETQERLAITQGLPERIANLSYEISAVAKDAAALERAATLATAGSAAAHSEDRAGAEAAIAQLQALLATLKQEYTVRVVSRPGEKSGFERTAPNGGKAYYLIVEAIDAAGKALTISVRDDETSQTQSVSRWGIRVDKSIFDAVRQDKMADGIVNNAIVGRKQLGAMAPEYVDRVSDSAITRW